MGRNFLCLCAGLMAASPCRAEFLRFDGAGGQTRALLKINGKSHDLPVAWMRPEKPAPGASLFVETVANGDLAPAALRRGMTVAVIDLAKLPGDSRAQALRDLAPALRLAASAGRILARGDRETGADLAEAGAFFDGLLLKDSSAGAAGTRVIETFGSDAYWRAAPRTGAKAGDADNRRRFFLAGTAEAGATGNCAAQVNARSPAPALRALLVALEEWTKGVKPPPSRVPAAGELVAARELNWPKIPGLAAPAPDDRLVPRIDPDGNETSGLRLPDHALPIATFTGFNTRKDRNGAPCAAGAAAPFPPSRGDRERNGDPRLSLLERYGSRAYFVATMRVVADRLVKDRLLLKEDADAYVATAKTAPF